jgi:hypothetical protein
MSRGLAITYALAIAYSSGCTVYGREYLAVRFAENTGAEVVSMIQPSEMPVDTRLDRAIPSAWRVHRPDYDLEVRLLTNDCYPRLVITARARGGAALQVRESRVRGVGLDYIGLPDGKLLVQVFAAPQTERLLDFVVMDSSGVQLSHEALTAGLEPCGTCYMGESWF